MAKRGKKGSKKGARRARKGARRARKSAPMGKTLASPTFGGRKFKCYGRRVRAGRSRTKRPRVFCRKASKK